MSRHWTREAELGRVLEDFGATEDLASARGRILAFHRGSFHVQIVHVHPCFTPDGAQVLYTADPDGYGQVFLADVPAFEALPTLDDTVTR